MKISTIKDDFDTMMINLEEFAERAKNTMETLSGNDLDLLSLL